MIDAVMVEVPNPRHSFGGRARRRRSADRAADGRGGQRDPRRDRGAAARPADVAAKEPRRTRRQRAAPARGRMS